MTNPSNLVYIESVKRPSSQGRHIFQNAEGTLIGKTKAVSSTGETMSDVIKFNHTVNNPYRLNTGLDELLDNPYHQYDSFEETGLPVSWKESYIWTQPKIKEQHLWEIKDNVPYGTYDSAAVDMFTRKPADYKPTFLQRFELQLNENVTILNLDTIQGRFGYRLCQKNSQVANSKQEANSTYHTHYISSIHESTERKVAQRRKVAKTMASLSAVLEKGAKTLPYKLAVVLKEVKGNVSEEHVQDKLFSFISEDKGKELGANIDKLQYFIDLATKKETKREFEAEYALAELENHLVIYNNREVYKWPGTSLASLEIIGNNRAKTIEFILDPNNKEYVEAMFMEMQSKGGPKLSI